MSEINESNIFLTNCTFIKIMIFHRKMERKIGNKLFSFYSLHLVAEYGKIN